MMLGLIEFLRNLLYKFIGKPASVVEVPPEEVRYHTQEPQTTKIDGEAVFGIKDGHLVVIVDHQFSDMPSWVEWDAGRKMVNITQISGDMGEVPADIKDVHFEALMDMKKVLLVSNDNAQKIVHFVPFLARK